MIDDDYKQELLDALADLARSLKAQGRVADSLTCTRAAIWIDGEERYGNFLDAALVAATGSILSPYAADKIRAYAREMREKKSRSDGDNDDAR